MNNVIQDVNLGKANSKFKVFPCKTCDVGDQGNKQLITELNLNISVDS